MSYRPAHARGRSACRRQPRKAMDEPLETVAEERTRRQTTPRRSPSAAQDRSSPDTEPLARGWRWKPLSAHRPSSAARAANRRSARLRSCRQSGRIGSSTRAPCHRPTRSAAAIRHIGGMLRGVLPSRTSTRTAAARRTRLARHCGRVHDHLSSRRPLRRRRLGARRPSAVATTRTPRVRWTRRSLKLPAFRWLPGRVADLFEERRPQLLKGLLSCARRLRLLSCWRRPSLSRLRRRRLSRSASTTSTRAQRRQGGTRPTGARRRRRRQRAIRAVRSSAIPLVVRSASRSVPPHVRPVGTRAPTATTTFAAACNGNRSRAVAQDTSRSGHARNASRPQPPARSGSADASAGDNPHRLPPLQGPLLESTTPGPTKTSRPSTQVRLANRSHAVSGHLQAP
mgnify:CR=1 FL=1